MNLHNTYSAFSQLDEYLTFNFVSTVLTEVLAVEKEPLVISAKSEDYIFDSSSQIRIDEECNSVVTNIQKKYGPSKTESTVLGSVFDKDKNRYSFALYFALEHNPITIPRSIIQDKWIGEEVKPFGVKGLSGCLYDSLFSLSIDSDNQSERYTIGDGRGYLVFTRS